MKRYSKALALVAGIAILALAGCARVPVAPAASVQPVEVILAGPITWADVESGSMPVLQHLAEGASLGIVASRDILNAAATLGEYPAQADMVGTVSAKGTPAEIDREIASAVMDAPEGAAIVVVSVPVAGTGGRAPAPALALITGGGYGAGTLTSASTHRAGLVTDGDLRTTVLTLSGADAAGSSGQPALARDDGRTPAERITRLAQLTDFLEAAEVVRVPIFYIYAVAIVLLLTGGAMVASRYRDGQRFAYWSLVLRRLVVLGLVLPVGATLLFVADRFPATPQRIVALLLAASGLLWIFCEFAWHKWGTSGALAFAGVIAALVLAVDQFTGAALTISSTFSYSPLAGFRFFGIGNEGAAIMVGGALLGLSLELDAVTVAPRVRRMLIASVGALCVFACAAPVFGANVVVAVWAPVALVTFWIAAEKRRVRLVDLLIGSAIVIGSLALMVALDRFSGGGTHIGRAVSDAAAGGLPSMLAARFATSVRIFTDSPLPAIVLVLTAGLAYLRARPRGRMADVIERYPMFGAAITAALVGGVVGALVEDSGVVVLALVVVYLLGGLVALMLVPDGGVSP